MTLAAKVAATLGLTAGVGVAVLEVALQTTAPGLTGQPVIDGLIGGGTVTAVALAILKTRLDRIERDIEKKADVSALETIQKDIREIRIHLMGDK